MPVDQPPSVAPVVVQSAQLPPSLGDQAYSIVTVDPQILALSTQLDEALDSVPGFSLYRSISSLGANPTTQGVSLRGIAGSAASRALVTLDGVPQNDPFGGWVIWTGLPPETIASANVVRGAGSGPYGAGALEGVVALESPARVEGGFSGDVEGGSLGYARAAGITETDFGASRLFLDASGETSAGWIPVIQGRGPVDKPLWLDDWSAAERVESDLSGGVVMSERIAGFEENRGAGALFAGSIAQGAQGSLTFVKAPDDGDLGWRVQAWAMGSNLVNTSASVSLSRQTATLADDQYATPAVGVGFNAALRKTEADYSWEVGADVRDFDGQSEEHLYNQGVPTGDRTAGGGELVGGVYGEGSRRFGPWLLTGGVRLDGWDDYASSLVQTGSAPVDQHTPDRGGAVPTGRLGVRRDVARELYARAAIYAGFRPVTLNELHRPYRIGNNVTEANPALQPERLYGAEAGFGGDAPIHWDADVFYNQLKDAVTNVTIGQGPGAFPLAGYVPAGGILYERQNVGAINAYGLEADADDRLAARLDLRLAFSLTHARVDGGDQDPQLTGRRPADTPSTVATADLVWQATDRLSLSGEARYEGARFDDDLNTLKIDAGTGVNVRADWRVNHTLGAFIAADNVFNAELETGRSATNVVSYDAPRLIRVGLILRR